MPELTRTQLFSYGAAIVAVLLIGARWVRADEAAQPAEGLSFPARESAAGSAGPGEGGEDVVVHVAGEVKRPGVYRLPIGARVTDAIERAGGANGRGSLDAINLAARLADGQQVVVPARLPGGAAAASAPDGPISLGSASADDLEEIDGIGEVTAAKIIEFRDSRGGLGSIEELDEVSGIGPATLDSLRDRLQP